ncbi:MAG: epoxide hydrolase-like predicted phosphatase [Gammaproteobacteria bacterium]|jgi:epoxide hydrolase-like predicted phosphatase
MPVEALLFDLGGVVIDIDFQRIFKKWSFYSGVPAEDIKAAFHVDDAYKQHERGEIEGKEYHQHLAQLLGMEISYEQFREGWNDIMVAPIDHTVGMLATLKTQLPLYALSNANTLHKQYWEETFHGELAHFEKIFVSSDIGYRKPEPDTYQHVFDDIGIAAQNIVFFDDLIENVEAARALGVTAVQVRSSLDIEKFIAEYF